MPDVRIRFTPSEKKVIVKVVDENEVLASFSLKAKKTLDGNIIIYDHADIDVILRPEQKKIVTFKKDGVNGDIAYGAADRLFKYLSRIELNKLEDIYKIGESYNSESVFISLEGLKIFFQDIEQYEKCAVIKKYQDLLLDNLPHKLEI